MFLPCASSEAAGIKSDRTAESASAENAGSPENRPVNAADFQGKDWILEEIRTNSATVRINRPDNVECYTLRFDAERVSGIGHPNRFSGPYTAGEAGSLTIGNMASTLMASFFEIDGIREHEYFAYLSKTKNRDILNGKLELTTSGGNGGTVVLVYR
jgi:heat shock protein HslJ